MRGAHRAPAIHAWVQAARRSTRLKPPFTFHVAPQSARAAIAVGGLDCVKRREFPPVVQVPAVYVWGRLSEAIFNTWDDWEGPWDVWAVSVPYVALEPDPEECSAWRSRTPVPRKHLAWLGEPPRGRPRAPVIERAIDHAWPDRDQLGWPPM